MFEVWQNLESTEFLCKTRIFVPDKPGVLAKIAEAFAKNDINIVFFYYNRSEHPNRVIIEGKTSKKEALDNLYQEFSKEGFWEEKFDEELHITTVENILKVSVFIENKPGTLARFSKVLKDYNVNVVYMIYNELVSENQAEIAMYVESPDVIKTLAEKLNSLGYHYHLEYTGTRKEDTDKVIGLNLIERFFLRLKEVLSEEEVNEIKNIIGASKKLSETLLNFSRELGKHLEAGQIFNNILVFAMSSREKLGDRFFYKKLPSLPIGDLILHTFRMPTGGNVYVLEAEDEYVMIDGGYGIYYEDTKKMLTENGINPEKISRIYISHADADHAGMSGYFYEEFRAEVFMHPECKGVIEHNNRAYGTNTPLFLLNQFFTVLVNYFTKCKFPENWKSFSSETKYELGGFPVIDEFKVGSCKFLVLKSLGGHVPGQVFFLSEDAGILYSADYLLYIPSLTPEEKKILSIPKYLMLSTNTNSSVFKKEMGLLTDLVKELDKKLQKSGKGMLILPGHGDYYPARLLK